MKRRPVTSCIIGDAMTSKARWAGYWGSSHLQSKALRSLWLRWRWSLAAAAIPADPAAHDADMMPAQWVQAVQQAKVGLFVGQTAPSQLPLFLGRD